MGYSKNQTKIMFLPNLLKNKLNYIFENNWDAKNTPSILEYKLLEKEKKASANRYQLILGLKKPRKFSFPRFYLKF